MSNEYENFINQDFGKLSKWLSSLNPYEFTLIATTIGLAISPALTVNQQNSLGNFFELIGQVILTINAQNVTKSQYIKRKSGIKPELETSSIEEELILIKKEIIELRNISLGNNK